MKLERDFYWAPTSLESLIDHHQSKEDEAQEQALSLGADMDDDTDKSESTLAEKDLEVEIHPRVAEIQQEVIDNDLPFSQAEEPASTTPDISWFYEPGYRKYAIAPRPTERKDRLVGNMVSEH